MDALPHQELLLVLAEVSVAIAGFAGVIAAIGTSGRVDERQEIRALVIGAASVLLGSLFPLVLSAAPIDVISVWRIASGIALASLLAYYITTPRDAFLLIRASGWYPFFVGGDVVMLLGFGIVVSGYAGDRYSSLIYIGSQFWILFQVLTLFVRAVSPLWKAAD